MVALALSQGAKPGDEVQGLFEALEAKTPFDPASVVHKGPPGDLCQIALSLLHAKRRNAAATRRADLGAQIDAHAGV